MQKYLDKYVKSLVHSNVSPYELLDILDIRDVLYEHEESLSEVEKNFLLMGDSFLIRNSDTFYEKISPVYNFEDSSDIPSEQWWWHLDRHQELKENPNRFIKKTSERMHA